MEAAAAIDAVNKGKMQGEDQLHRFDDSEIQRDLVKNGTAIEIKP